MKLSEKIYYCRKKNGLSQEALAEKLSVSRQAVSKWETGESEPEISKLKLLAEAFGVSTDWLLSNADPAEEKPQDTPPKPQLPQNDLPGYLGKLVKKYGWLAGIYISLCGVGAVVIGSLARFSVKRMFMDIVAAFGSEVLQNNLVYQLGGIVCILGFVGMIVGVILAIFLKKKYK